jgi:hypothetical protein
MKLWIGLVCGLVLGLAAMVSAESWESFQHRQLQQQQLREMQRQNQILQQQAFDRQMDRLRTPC